MSIKLNEENGGKVLVVHVSGKLVKRITRSLCLRSRNFFGCMES